MRAPSRSMEFRALVACPSTEPTRPALQGLFYDAKCAAWVSTDGGRLFVARTLPHPPSGGIYKVAPFKADLDFVPLPGLEFPEYEFVVAQTPVGPDTARFWVPDWVARLRRDDKAFFALRPDPVRLDTRLQDATFRLNLSRLAPLAGEQVYLHWYAHEDKDVAYLTPGPVKDLWEHPWWMAVTGANRPGATWFCLEDVKS